VGSVVRATLLPTFAPPGSSHRLRLVIPRGLNTLPDLAAINAHLGRSRDAQTDAVPSYFENGQNEMAIRHHHFLTDHPAQNQHGEPPPWEKFFT
jgi:hypothetical protein